MRQPPRSLRRIRDQIAAGTVGALAQRYQQGKIKYRVDVVGGLENAPKALNKLFDGPNTGKLVVKLA